MNDIIYTKAIKYLARRNYFSNELKNKLNKCFSDESVKINLIVKKLQNLKYLDDDNTACLYIKELQKKRFGIFYIKNKLFQKGLEISFIDTFLQKYYDKELEEENLKNLKQEKSKTYSHVSIKDKAKLNRFLKSRGF